MANKKNTVICRYKYCKHDSKDILREEAKSSGNSRYYHSDCFKEMKEKEEIKRLFVEKISRNVPIPQLVKIINTIVHNKNISSEYLLFGLQYYIDNHKTLRYPAGLYYVIADKDVETEYNKLKNRDVKCKFDIEEEIEGFEYKKPVTKTLDNFMTR